MRNCAYPALFLCLFMTILDAASGPSESAALAGPAHSLSVSAASLAVKAEYGCGWDYPCAPRPFFRRNYRRGSGQVYIHNNYGTVNVFESGRRHRREPRIDPRPWRPDGDGDGRGSRDGGSRNCGESPCERECGVACWYRRIKEGYCGHGCEVYRDSARYDRNERSMDYPSQDYGRGAPPPPPYDPGYRDDAPPRYQRPAGEDRFPRRRFEGPDYPPNCSGNTC